MNADRYYQLAGWARTAILLSIAIATFLVVGGCATTPPAPTLSTSALIRPVALTSTSSAANIEAGFIESLAGCQVVLRGLEDQSNLLKRWGVGIQLAGAIAGSILLPVAVVAGTAESVLTALGAFAGFTNTAISVVKNEALDAASIISQRAMIQSSMGIALNKFYSARARDPMDKPGAIAALDELRVACISYALISPTGPVIAPPQ